jgi:hypothetical protein
MNPTRYRAIALALLLTSLPACTTWRPTPLAPARFIAEETPHEVRAVRRDGSAVVVSSPRIVRDSIAVVAGECRRRSPFDDGYVCPTRGVVALDDVTRVDVRGPAGMSAQGAALGAIIGVALLVVAVGTNAGGGG